MGYDWCSVIRVAPPNLQRPGDVEVAAAMVEDFAPLMVPHRILMIACAVAWAICGIGTVVPEHAQAQTSLFPRELFSAPSAVVDYESGYARVEDCLAAIARVRASASWGMVTGLGSEIGNLADPRNSELPPVIATARRCGARFSPATVGAADLPLLLELMLYAGDDAAAEATLARQLALLPADAPVKARAQALSSALVFAATHARPARLSWAERLLDQIKRLGEPARVERIAGYHALMEYALAVYDTTHLDLYVKAIGALRDSMRVPPSMPQGADRSLVVAAEVDAYRNRRLLRIARGVTPDSSVMASPIQADFWFRRADSTSRPSRNRIALVAFVDAVCLEDCYDAGPYTFLRNLHERFGDALEITLVTHTHGSFRNYPLPLQPADEAGLLRDYFFGHLKLPGALAVETTPFSRLPHPDRRVVDQPPRNITNYWRSTSERVSRFGLRAGPLSGTYPHNSVGGFLVDRDGSLIIELDAPDFWWRSHRAVIAAIGKTLAAPAATQAPTSPDP